MMRARRRGRVWGWVLAAAAALPGVGAAQERVLPPPALVLVAGGLSYDAVDLDGTGMPVPVSGTGRVVGLRADFPLSDLFTLEPALERVTWTGADGDDETRWIIDFGVNLGYGFGRVTPYAGGNLGVALDFAEDRAFDEEFLEALFGGHGGVRVAVHDRVDLRGEVRGRWFDRFESTWISYVGGVSWRW